MLKAVVLVIFHALFLVHADETIVKTDLYKEVNNVITKDKSIGIGENAGIPGDREDIRVSKGTKEVGGNFKDSHKYVHIIQNKIKDEEMEELRKLEGKRSDLVKQINKEVAESIATLRANDSHPQNVEMLKRVREQMERLNLSDANHGNIRRSNLFTFIKNTSKHKDVSDERYIQLMHEREQMEKKIKDWIQDIKNVEEEADKKKRKQKYNDKLLYEKCPPYGYAKKKIKDSDKDDYRYTADSTNYTDTRKSNGSYIGGYSNIDVNYMKGKARGRKRYPCCRKCCKKSYLGCL